MERSGSGSDRGRARVGRRGWVAILVCGTLGAPMIAKAAVNLSLPPNGGTAVASSSHAGYPASGANDGIFETTTGGGYWNDNTNNVYPDNIAVQWTAPRSIGSVRVRMPVASNLTAGQRTLGQLTVQYLNGSVWTSVTPNSNFGQVNPVYNWVIPTSDNGTQIKDFFFAPVSTTSVRVLFSSGNSDGWSFLDEIEAYDSHDFVSYHNGRVISPVIKCLLWSPSGSGGFSATDVDNIHTYVHDMQDYFSNAAAPNASTGAGAEPVPRQYGVWGAYWDGTCYDDRSTPSGLIDFTDTSASSVVATEVARTVGTGSYSKTSVVLVLTKGWSYNNPGNDRGFHWSLTGAGSAPNQYIALATDAGGADPRDITAHELIETATDTDGTGWTTNQVPGCYYGAEVCDDGLGYQASFKYVGTDGYRWVGASVDNIDGVAGTQNNCSPSGSPSSTNAFTNVTTTPPVAVVQAGGRINVISRTSTGLVHLVPGSTMGGAFTQITPPSLASTETPAVFSSDGTTIDLYARGTDGGLYHSTFNGSSWTAPTYLGGYLIGPPSAGYATIGGVPSSVVLSLATTGQIAAYVNGSWAPFLNMPTNVLAMSPPQVFRVSSTCLEVYFTGTDSQVYRQGCFSPTAPSSAWVAVPTTATAFNLLSSSYDAVPARTTVILSEPVGPHGSQLQYASYNGASWTSGLMLPLTTIGPASTYVQSNGQVKVFTTGADGMLYISNSGTNGLGFSGWFSVSASLTSPPVTFTPDGSSAWVFGRASGSNQLVYWHWTGTAWDAQNASTGASVM